MSAEEFLGPQQTYGWQGFLDRPLQALFIFSLMLLIAGGPHLLRLLFYWLLFRLGLRSVVHAVRDLRHDRPRGRSPHHH